MTVSNACGPGSCCHWRWCLRERNPSRCFGTRQHLIRHWFYWLASWSVDWAAPAITWALADWTPEAGLVGQTFSIIARLGIAYTLDILLWCFLLALIAHYRNLRYDAPEAPNYPRKQKPGCPISSRSFFARCGIPLLSPLNDQDQTNIAPRRRRPARPLCWLRGHEKAVTNPVAGDPPPFRKELRSFVPTARHATD